MEALELFIVIFVAIICVDLFWMFWDGSNDDDDPPGAP